MGINVQFGNIPDSFAVLLKKTGQKELDVSRFYFRLGSTSIVTFIV